MSTKVVFITTTGAGTFTVPNDFGSLVSVEAIGGGGGSSSNQSNNAGAGGGAYAKSTTVAGLYTGGTAYYSVGVGGTGGLSSDGGVTWFNALSNAQPTLATQGVLAAGGSGANSATAASGGSSASSIGTLTYSGGNGGAGAGSSDNSGGGGGGAGPDGAGKNGGAGYTGGNLTDAGSGGGGGAAGPSSTAGSNGTISAGGAGGSGGGGTGGGAGAASTSAAVAGTSGTGAGGGGGSRTSSTTYPGGDGSTYNYWTQSSNSATAGPGGGGGGNSAAGSSGAPGAGGLYGGAAGGFGNNSANGAQGIIVFTYNVSATGQGNIPYQPGTGFRTTDPNTNNTQDLGSRYITKNYLLDVYPNIASATGNRTAPGLWIWGNGNHLQLGLGIQVASNYSSPVQIGALTTWKQAASGIGANLAIKKDGTLWSWGGWKVSGSWFGETGQNGQAYYSSPTQVGALTTWKQIAAGIASTAAIKTDGTLWTWGNTSTLATVYSPLGILGDGSTTNKSSPVQVGALTTWKNIAIGATSMYGISIDGSLWTWGANFYGQLGRSFAGGTTLTGGYYSSPVQVGALTNWKQISAQYFALAVKTDGTLWTWGSNVSGSLGLGTSGSAYYSSPIQVGSLTNWKQVSVVAPGYTNTSGEGSALAIKTDGTLWAWGNNTWGQLGNSTITYYSSPIQVGSLTNWKYVQGGYGFASALKTDGTLWAWGANYFGQLGQGNVTYYSSPIQVGSLTTWKTLAQSSYGTNILAIQDGYI